MPLDAALAALAPLMVGQPELDGSIPVTEVRKHFDDLQIIVAAMPGVPHVPARELLIDGRIPVRVYDAVTAPAPTIVFFHGGGFTIGSIATHDRQVRELATACGAVVVSVDYRLAPEHPFPAGIQDAWDALEWAAQHIDDLGGDADQLLVAGDSAGANFSAVLSILARDRGGPTLRGQVLIYPPVDLRDVPDYPSRDLHAEDGLVLTESIMRWFEDNYAADPLDVRASPILADSLAGLPPAVIVTAEYDPLCSEGELYAERLAAADVPVWHRRFDGQVHGFFAIGMLGPSVQTCIDQTCAMVREHLL